MKCFPVKIVDNGSCREELVKLIGEHINNYLKKEQNKYKGLISIIKIGEEVNKENEEEIRKISLAIEEERLKNISS